MAQDDREADLQEANDEKSKGYLIALIRLANSVKIYGKFNREEIFRWN